MTSENSVDKVLNGMRISLSDNYTVHITEVDGKTLYPFFKHLSIVDIGGNYEHRLELLLPSMLIDENSLELNVDATSVANYVSSSAKLLKQDFKAEQPHYLRVTNQQTGILKFVKMAYNVDTNQRVRIGDEIFEQDDLVCFPLFASQEPVSVDYDLISSTKLFYVTTKK